MKQEETDLETPLMVAPSRKTRLTSVAPARKASVLYPIMGIWGCFPVIGMYRSPLLKAKIISRKMEVRM